MNFPIIKTDKCPVDSCASEADGGPAAPALDLRPGQARLCLEATAVFRAYLMTAVGETLLTVGVTFSTSDDSVLSIDPDTGAATVEGVGEVTIKAEWGDLVAFAQITVVEPASNDCCGETTVRIVVVGDESLSMQDVWMAAGTRRRNLTYQILRYGLSGPLVTDAILGERTKAAVVLFSGVAQLYEEFSDDPTTVLYPASVPGSIAVGDETNIGDGLLMALETLSTDPADQEIIILFSDGINRPALSTDDKEEIIANANNFKAGGGVIICFGLGATSEGFDLLRQISSSGFFVNIVPPLSDTPAQDAAVKLTSMLCLLCAGTRPVTGYFGYFGDVYAYCADFDNGPQVPDVANYGDIEEGIALPVPAVLPQLPPVEFVPLSSLPSNSSPTITLSVPGFPDAFIRFTYLVGGDAPADPSFVYPDSLVTGQSYDGGYSPVPMPSSDEAVNIKAIARLAGYADSEVSSAVYPA